MDAGTKDEKSYGQAKGTTNEMIILTASFLRIKMYKRETASRF